MRVPPEDREVNCMHDSLLQLLVDPLLKTPLLLDVSQRGSQGEILEGALRNAAGQVYPIQRGIPRFLLCTDDKQAQTAASFGFKWGQRHTYESASMQAATRKWLIKRYGFANAGAMETYFQTRRRILDAGCGSGFSAALWMNPAWTGTEWIGVDISAAIDVARERLSSLPGTHLVQADLLQLPFGIGSFDTIFSEGVLHHTPSTEIALKSLAPYLVPGGEFLFYVYRRKGPVREFSDDHIRGLVSSLPPQEAWETLRPLTRLAKALSELDTEVEIPEDIPYLGIKAGRYDVQRLLYWHFAKLYWNNAYSFEENNHVNFDWYHPQYAHRQSEEEIRRWCAEVGLTIVHLDTEEMSGFTVRAIRS